MQHRDIGRIDTHLVGHDHRPAGVMTLPVRGRAGDDLDLPGWKEAHNSVLPATGPIVEPTQGPAGRQTTDLDIGADSNAEVFGFATIATALLHRA